MELRQLKFISDLAESRIKRRKIVEDEIPLPQEVARECYNAGEDCSPQSVLKTALEKEEGVEDQLDNFAKFGVTSVCGRRRDMEDAVSIRPCFTGKSHFYGVFDGHGCSHVCNCNSTL